MVISNGGDGRVDVLIAVVESAKKEKYFSTFP